MAAIIKPLLADGNRAELGGVAGRSPAGEPWKGNPINQPTAAAAPMQTTAAMRL
jgi:hypothetical protein